MRPRISTDHVVIDTRTQEFACLHCGWRYPLHTPVPIDLFLAMSREITKLHRRCKTRERKP